jgi:Uma2 family endonuclease
MATTSQVAQLLTAEDLLRMPADGFRYELVRGELRKMPPAGDIHGKIAGKFWRLGRYVEEHHLGAFYVAETGFQLASDPDTVRAPAVAFVRRERVEEVGDIEEYFPGASDLAIEVISPSDTYTKVKEKVIEWLDAGTRIVMVIDPRMRMVTVYRSRSNIVILSEGEILDGGDVVPGWTMPVGELFTFMHS